MAKRFTDTDKWGKSWFRKLSPKMKLIWFYLLDNCDIAGFWDIDLEAMSFMIGDTISLKDLESFEDRLVIFGDKLHLKGFTKFQYGELNEKNRVHKSVLEKLKKSEISPLLGPLNSEEGPSGKKEAPYFSTEGAKDKDKDKDKEKDKDKDKEKDKDSLTQDFIIKNFNAIEKLPNYPGFFFTSEMSTDFAELKKQKLLQEKQDWINYFQKVSNSEFLINDHGTTLNWLIRPNNVTKVLGGTYDKSLKNKLVKNDSPDASKKYVNIYAEGGQ